MAILLNHILSIVHIIALVISPCVYALKHESNTEKPWFQNTGNNKNIVKLHFYVHDFIGGPNMTVYEVARSSITSTSPTQFGKVFVFDDPITAEPDINSKELGRAQGQTVSSDLRMLAIALNYNIYFTIGKLSGSTISIAGRNPLLNETRELAVVGGTGVFRNARGYAITRTYSYDQEIPYMILEYILHVSVRTCTSICT